uniref:Uncharacterized protein n=1 Tax=Rhizophora mucronata TaxID=61149 RepID=A0A2P2QKK7_RHIMU
MVEPGLQGDIICPLSYNLTCQLLTNIVSDYTSEDYLERQCGRNE